MTKPGAPKGNTNRQLGEEPLEGVASFRIQRAERIRWRAAAKAGKVPNLNTFVRTACNAACASPLEDVGVEAGADLKITFRMYVDEKSAWHRAAEQAGCKSLAVFVRAACNAAADKVLE